MTNFPLSYPEEYKAGKVTFFGRNFLVNENVLIPRLETEVLVRRARQILRTKKFSKIIDIGSGSGIIGTSLADFDTDLHFVDISDKALEVAKINFEKNFPQKNATFWHSDLLQNLDFLNNCSENILLVSNLPYIKNDDWNNMSEDTVFEPKIALFGGEKTGFELYEKLFEHILAKNFHGIMIIEFGFDQRLIAEKTIQKIPHWKAEFFADYAGIERFAEIIF